MLNNFIKKLYILTNAKNRINLFLLLLLLIFSSFLEMIGIGLIPAILLSIQNPEIIFSFMEKNNFATSMFNKENILTYVILVSIIFFIFKNLFLSIILYFEYRVIVGLSVNIQRKLYSYYINSSFVNFSKLNPSIIQNNLISESKRIVVLINSFLKFIKEFFVAFLILISILYLNPLVVTIVILIFSLSSLLFYFFFKTLLSNSSERFMNNTKKSVKKINDLISSFREIKNFKKENWFTDLFTSYIYKKETEQTFQNFVFQLPRIYLEILVVIIILSMVLFFNQYYKYNDELFVFLSFFVIATIRFYPAYNVMLSSLSRMRSNVLAFHNISSILKDFNENLYNKNKTTTKSFIDFNKIIFNKINFSYDSKKIILENISFEVPQGSKVGFIGESGSGKSTLLDIFSKFQLPNSGSIKLDEVDINKLNENWYQNYSYVSQKTFLFDDTIKNNITFNQQEDRVNYEKLNKSLEMSHLNAFINDLDNGIDTIVGHDGINLSGGQRQRIAIARALYASRPILLLDEATNSLDSNTENIILNNIINNNKKTTVFIISHRPDSLNSCDKVYEIVDSRIKVIK